MKFCFHESTKTYHGVRGHEEAKGLDDIGRYSGIGDASFGRNKSFLDVRQKLLILHREWNDNSSTIFAHVPYVFPDELPG